MTLKNGPRVPRHVISVPRHITGDKFSLTSPSIDLLSPRVEGGQSQGHPVRCGLKWWLVETVMDNEFQSHPCFHIQYTHNETLEQSNCCDVGGMIPSHAILVWKVGIHHQANF
eukprot:scaffold50627_cov25-Cyclotella_meneghiniana.AAC.1